MGDETTRFDAGSEGAPGPGTTTESTIGFCQDCGKPVTATTARPVGSALFCEPCLQTRLGKQTAGAGATGAGATGTGYTPGYVPAAGPSNEPNPALAGWLGLIPGVGAMYNGQYGKGIIHLAIFAVFVSFANHVDSIFGLFVAAWIFYGSFEAYHTARARRDGLPVPNAFGLNDIGDRMGFGKNWPTGSVRPVGVPVGASVNAAGATPTPPSPPVTTAPSTGWTPVNQNPVPVVPPPAPAYPDWVGYVPPATVSPYAAAPYTASAGYAQTPPVAAPYQAYVPPVPATDYAAASSSRSFPVIAIVLIVLGVLFVMANFVPNMHLSASWLLAILFGIFSALAFARRLGYLGGVSYRGNLFCAMRGPIMLAVLAVLFLLWAVGVATLGQTWPVILVAFGAIMLLERTVGTPSTLEPAIPYAAAAYTTAAPVQETTRSEVNGNEVEKGGL